MGEPMPCPTLICSRPTLRWQHDLLEADEQEMRRRQKIDHFERDARARITTWNYRRCSRRLIDTDIAICCDRTSSPTTSGRAICNRAPDNATRRAVASSLRVLTAQRLATCAMTADTISSVDAIFDQTNGNAW